MLTSFQGWLQTHLGSMARNPIRPDGLAEQNIIAVDVEDSVVQKLAESDSKFVLLSSEAKAATEAEHAMTLGEALRSYPKAVLWSIFFSTAVAMEGYDLVLISGFFAFPPFQHKYGIEGKPGKYQIPAPWQAGLGNGARAGEIMGLLLNGIVCERFGFKKTMIGTLVLMAGLLFIPFFAQNIQTLLVSQLNRCLDCSCNR
jgi:MFS transporter, SP family, general alpha glucoside:H+ symporter